MSEEELRKQAKRVSEVLERMEMDNHSWFTTLNYQNENIQELKFQLSQFRDRLDEVFPPTGEKTLEEQGQLHG